MLQRTRSFSVHSQHLICTPTVRSLASVRWSRKEIGANSGVKGSVEHKEGRDLVVVVASALSVAVVTTLSLTIWREPIEDLMYAQTFTGAGSSFGAGDVFGGLLWAGALYYCSPLQLLLLFLGKIETERPSDWLLHGLGRLTGQRIDEVDYVAPAPLRAVMLLAVLLGGFVTAWAFRAGLGDATWSISTGIGALMAAAVYEVGRPQRLSPQAAQQLEGQWQDFARFADAELQRGGRCHESEVWAAFRRAVPRYRAPGAISETVLRDMVRNWHPDVERTSKGFYRNLSLQLRVDPFTGQVVGSQLAKLPRQQAGAAEGGTQPDAESLALQTW